MTKKSLKTKTTKKCWYCGGEIGDRYLGLRDKLLGVNDVFNIKECRNCGIAFTDPMPYENMAVLYPEKYLSDRIPKKRFDMEKWYRDDRYIFDFSLVKKATGLDIANFGSYIDVGCGTGEQLMFVRERGCKESWGLDKFDHLKNKTANMINKGIEEYFPKKKIKVVSLFAVLEHVVNPKEVLMHIRSEVIDKNGFLIISVPNYGSVERKVFGKRWYCLDVPRHLWHFSEKSVGELLDKCGYEVVRVYKKNAWLHPVSFAPSLIPDADIGKVWGEPGAKGHGYWMFMRWMWLGLTLLSLPINWGLSLLNQASTMMIVAKPKKVIRKHKG